MKTNVKLYVIWAGLACCTILAASAVPVTFQVNLEHQIRAGNFSPGSDRVEVRGVFNDWVGGLVLASSPINSNIYQGTIEVTKPAPGGSVEYKFVINGSTWEETALGPAVNRSFVLENGAQTLPVVFFGDACISPPIPITFRVNMAAQIAKKNFDPATETVEARGSFQSQRKWKGGFTLTNSPSSPAIYQGTYKVPLPPNARIAYKFVIKEPSDITWESTPDRVLTLPTNALALPPVYFNDQPD
jgi:hypothetical protein